MKKIDMENWPRKQHFDFFNNFDYPHFNITLDLDITRVYNYIKENEISFFKTMVYFVTKTANNIKEFRYRVINNNQVVEFEEINPSFTIMSEENVFSFCNSKYFPDKRRFFRSMEENIKRYKDNPAVSEEEDKIDSIYLTSLPWISFNSITHPIDIKNVDSVPRIAWGKYKKEDSKVLLPFSIQVHHGLMDGYHVSKYVDYINGLINNTQKYL
mgnify:CR=1 FL=1|jgi:chloramphenicol O-acetyltransferase type A